MSTDPSSVDTGAEVDGTEADKINTGALGTLVAVGLFAMLSITAAVTALVRHDLEVEEASKDADANQVVVALKASQRGALNGPAAYVDRGKGLVSLPIDLAKGLVVAELERDPNSATPPAAAKPAASAGDASAAPDHGSGRGRRHGSCHTDDRPQIGRRQGSAGQAGNGPRSPEAGPRAARANRLRSPRLRPRRPRRARKLQAPRTSEH